MAEFLRASSPLFGARSPGDSCSRLEGAPLCRDTENVDQGGRPGLKRRAIRPEPIVDVGKTFELEVSTFSPPLHPCGIAMVSDGHVLA